MQDIWVNRRIPAGMAKFWRGMAENVASLALPRLKNVTGGYHMLSTLLVSATMVLGQVPAMSTTPDLGAYSSPCLPMSATTAPGIGLREPGAAAPARVVTTSGLAAQAGNEAPDHKNGASEGPTNSNKESESTPSFPRTRDT